MALQSSSCSSLNCVSIGFLNANHSKTANILLDRDITIKGLDLVLLNEPYFSDYGIIYFNKIYRIVYSQTKPRTVIVINPTLKFSALAIERDLIILNIKHNKDRYIMINMYIPPTVSIEDYLHCIELYVTK